MNFKSAPNLTLFVLALFLINNNASAQVNYQWMWHVQDSAQTVALHFGTQGVSAPSNNPGAREKGLTWKDNDGNLWLFGGYNFINIDGITSSSAEMGDLWKFDPQSQIWTWVNGSSSTEPDPVYGDQGFSSPENDPGGRVRSMSWNGKDGTFWLFGGNTPQGTKNDLWNYDPSTNSWTWVSGSTEWGAPSVYGTIGVPADSTVPGARSSAVSWTDKEGNLWLMGGMRRTNTSSGSSSGQIDDLWKFDVVTEQWTWVDGSQGVSLPVYGDKGVPGNFVSPGSRSNAMGWTGADGNLWFFGGDISYRGNYNDLFKFDTTTEQWTWVSGAALPNQSGNYGILGVESASNQPGARSYGNTWSDGQGNLWLLGGAGRDDNGDYGGLDDLWRFNIYTEQWTWMGGSRVTGIPASYNEKGIPSTDTNPGVKIYSHTWVGNNGHVWLYGGNKKGELWQLISEPGVASFNGSTSFGRINNAPELNVSGQQELTIEAWVKANNVTQGGQTAIVTRGGVLFGQGLHLESSASTTTLIFSHLGASANFTAATLNNFSNSEWYHVAATYNGSNARIYMDGELLADSARTGSLSEPAFGYTDLLLGYDEFLNGGYLDGKLAEVRLWDKALTQEEIRANMNLSVSGKELNLLGAWLPRTGGRHSAVDQTGSGNNLALSDVSYTTDFPPVKTSISGTEGWRFLGAPGGSTSYLTLLDPLWTQGFTGSDGGTGATSNVYFYDESSKSWITPADASNTVGTNSTGEEGTGRGILMYVYADDNNDGTDDPFPKALQLNSFGSIPPTTIPLNYTNSGIYGNDGWNLVSNPYPVAIYWQKIVDDGANESTLDYAYIWDQDLNGGAGGYQVHFGEPVPPSFPGGSKMEFDGRIPAFQSFWVKAKEEGAQLRFNAGQFIPNRTLYKQPKETAPFIKLRAEHNDLKDEVGVIFPQTKDQIRDDAPKLHTLASNYIDLSIRDEEQQRWLVRHITSEEGDTQFEIPVGFESTAEGDVQLSWDIKTIPAEWNVLLEDKETGQSYDLRQVESISFQSIKSKMNQQDELKLPVAPGSEKQKAVGSTRFMITVTNATVTNTETDSEVPGAFGLNQNYPNPFNPATTISYQVPANTNVRLTVYDMLGREVALLVNERKQAGQHEVTFNASGLSSGVYFYRLQAGSGSQIRKMTLLK